MSSEETSLSDDLEKLDAAARTKRTVLARLLDEQREKRNHVMAVLAEMGDSISFVTVSTLKWVATNVRFALDLPTWKGKLDPSGKMIIDAETLDELRQRAPDWRRQIPMVRYLALREHHKFPPIVVVAWKPWVHDRTAEEWIDGVAGENSVTEHALDTGHTYIDLDCEDTEFYALDGQHRLMAIQGLQTLLQSRQLDGKDQYGNIRPNKSILLDDIIADMHFAERKGVHPSATMNALMQERIGLEIIPAVMQGETYESAARRMRSIFVDVNKHAKKLTTGELALLDEENGFAVVARRTMIGHKLLYNRVQTKQGQLAEAAKEYTTLENLVVMAKLYLMQFSEFAHWNVGPNELFQRPDDENLESGGAKFKNFINELSKLPSHNALVMDTSKSAGDFRIEGDSENIFFRPIAQAALADALGYLEIVRGKDLFDVFSVLSEREEAGALQMRPHASMWCGVLCDWSGKMQRHTRYRTLCSRLLVHLLGGGTPSDEREELENEYRNARARDAGNDRYVGADGKECSGREVKLPPPWM